MHTHQIMVRASHSRATWLDFFWPSQTRRGKAVSLNKNR